MIKRYAKLSKLTQENFDALGIPHALILMDVDNTLLSPYEPRILQVRKKWIQYMAQQHQILLCTNNFTKRQFHVSVDLNLPILMHSFKPFPWRVINYLKLHHVDLNTVIIVGDQMITDVILALWLKRPYFLIKPLEINKHWVMRFFRTLESMVIEDE